MMDLKFRGTRAEYNTLLHMMYVHLDCDHCPSYLGDNKDCGAQDYCEKDDYSFCETSMQKLFTSVELIKERRAKIEFKECL